MAIKLKKRGQYWFARGTVTWGNKSISIRQSTGRTLRREAQEVADELYEKALNTLKNGGSMTAVPFALAATNWIKVKRRGDTCRRNVKELGDFFKHAMVEEITADAWRRFVLETQANSRLEKQNELLSYYPAFATDLFHTYCYQGMRKSEGTRLLKEHVNFIDDLIYIRGETNHTGNSRFIPLHKKVKQRLEAIKNNHKNSSEFVFVNKNGQPYAEQGPRKVHDTARNKAGLPDFTIHDWRHHWASSLAMKGTNASTLMELGGWKSPEMVQRYVTIGNQYKSSQLNLLE